MSNVPLLSILTKREYIAAQVLAGIYASSEAPFGGYQDAATAARFSVSAADRLLEALEEKRP